MKREQAAREQAFRAAGHEVTPNGQEEQHSEGRTPKAAAVMLSRPAGGRHARCAEVRTSTLSQDERNRLELGGTEVADTLEQRTTDNPRGSIFWADHQNGCSGGCMPKATTSGGSCYKGAMRRDEIIQTLQARESDLRAHGVIRAALFGSVARDEQRPDSDIDILVELDPAVVATMFDYAGVKDYVAGLFQGSVDVIDRDALKPRLRPRAAADAIYAF